MLPLATNQLCHYSLKATVDDIGLANRFVQVLHTTVRKPKRTFWPTQHINKWTWLSTMELQLQKQAEFAAL